MKNTYRCQEWGEIMELETARLFLHPFLESDAADGIDSFLLHLSGGLQNGR